MFFLPARVGKFVKQPAAPTAPAAKGFFLFMFVVFYIAHYQSFI
mgnify:CR=1 FL=1